MHSDMFSKLVPEVLDVWTETLLTILIIFNI